MKRFFIVILSFLMLFPLMAEEDFFELCETGTALQISAAIKAGASVNDRDRDGWTPLMVAALYNDNPEVTIALLEAGASVNDRNDYGGTPLIYAAQYNSNPEVITALLKAGADATTKNNRNKTAFDYAKENEDLKGTSAYWELNNARF